MRGKEKEYITETDKTHLANTDDIDRYEPKPEFSTIKFDPNVRMRVPDMQDHLTKAFLYGHKELDKP